jgi:hypothetical protein
MTATIAEDEAKGGHLREGLWMNATPRRSSRLYRFTVGEFFRTLSNHTPCDACDLIAEDSDMTAEEAKTATLCGDCEAFYGFGEPEFCARCLQLDEACKCYAPTDGEGK